MGELTKQLSPSKVRVRYGQLIREVQVNVSKNAKFVSFSTEFDKTGLELDLYEFNSDFFSIYDKTAMVILGKVIRNSNLHLQVLEDSLVDDTEVLKR